ncbi:MAG: hypothetical protein V1760_01365 [Candidatus Peregrinibacteria bacterium]
MLKTFLFTAGLLIPNVAHAQNAQTTALGNVSNFGELVSLIWAYGSQVIMVLAIFFIVLGAFFYIASAGNEERLNQGKQMIMGSLVAIIIVLMSGVLIRTLHKPAEGTVGVLAEVPNVINNATNILIGVIGAFTALMLAYAGTLYIKGRGDADQIEKAHSAFRYALYGLVVGVLAYMIVNNIINFFM